MRKKWYFIAPLGIAALALFILVGGFLVQQLWNWLLPPLFGFPSITFCRRGGFSSSPAFSLEAGGTTVRAAPACAAACAIVGIS